MKVFNVADMPTELRTSTFTGVVYGDPLLEPTDGAALTSVFFGPGGRTYWHYHESGQILYVLQGRGFVCVQGGTPQPLVPGDVVWTAPGEHHWHGGGPDSMLLHLAVSLGKTVWLDPVSEEEYGAAGG